MNKKLIFSIAGIVILLIALGVGVFLVSRQQELREKAAPATTLSLNPGQKSVKTGETFILSVVVDTGQNSVTASELNIGFNPQIVEVQNVSAGTFLPVILLPATTDNVNGKTSLTLGSQPTEPKQGTGTLATITWIAKSAGNASIAFLPQTQVAGVGETGNVLVSTNQSIVTIAQTAATTSPTASPTLAPTASPTVRPTTTASPTASPTSSSSSGSSSSGSSGTSIGAGSATATPKATATAKATTTAKPTSTAATQLPQAGVSWPAVGAALGGTILLILGILLAF